MSSRTDAADSGDPGDGAGEGVGRRGWVVIAVVVFGLLVAPALILWRPPGLPYWVALLVLPLLPGVLLGAVAVWGTTRP